MTTSEWLLFNPKAELRSGWKFGAYVALFPIFWVATVFVLAGAYKASGLPASLPVELLLNAFALFVPAVGVTVLLGRLLDRTQASQFIGFNGWKGNLGRGLGIGAALLSILVAGFAALSRLSVGSGLWNSDTAFLTLFALVVSAANEEIAFRGYAMQVLARGIGRWPAAAVTAVLFGLLHARNPNASLLGIMNTVLAGLMLAAAYYKARSLWLPYGIHVAWNVGLGMVLGFPLSGMNLDSLWAMSHRGSALLSGGGYGPEGGLICTVAFGAGFAAIRLLRIPEPAGAGSRKQK
jgi:membrane protease YdiL (CAAX protease family)